MSKEIINEILLAEKEADEIIKEAHIKQKKILADAKDEADKLIIRAKEDANHAANVLLSACEGKMAAEVKKINEDYLAQAIQNEKTALGNMEKAIAFIFQNIAG